MFALIVKRKDRTWFQTVFLNNVGELASSSMPTSLWQICIEGVRDYHRDMKWAPLTRAELFEILAKRLGRWDPDYDNAIIAFTSTP